MAKLPYTYTICPPGPEPKQPTASCAQMGELLKNSPNGDLTINNRMPIWDSWTRKPIQAKSFEERFAEMLAETKREEKNT